MLLLRFCMSPFLSASRFHVTVLWRNHQVLFSSVLVAMVLAIVAACGLALAVEEGRQEEEMLAELVAARKSMALDSQPSDVRSGAGSQADQLPKFSSQEFIGQFYETATGVGVPVDEVAYALESADSKPYLRYRVTMAVKTRYLDVRKLIAALAVEMPHVSLDSIQCGRENTAALPLSCQLAFSAYFVKA